MPEDAPLDPITSMNEGAASLHELFISLVSTGFTEWQACRVIGVMLGEQGRQS